ncbi:MAG: hypothetical protein V7K89_03135 [Nostoc sp.]|uniref:hypothetical protein n=1 Tax=Nostoc sp. TaxID=1180 RepID=UPI002FF7C790
MAIKPKSLRIRQYPRHSGVANYGNRPSGDALYETLRERKLANATLSDARRLANAALTTQSAKTGAATSPKFKI